MGGMVAQELALRFPDRVRALVLGGTWHGGPRSVLPSPRVAAALTRRGAPAAVRAELVGRALFSERFRAEHPDLVARHLRNLAAHPASARGLALHLTATTYHDTRARLPRIAAPTLVMHGGADELTPVRNARLLADLIPDAALEVLPGAGHGYLLEQPAESHRRFSSWLAGPLARPAGAAAVRGRCARRAPHPAPGPAGRARCGTARSLVSFSSPRGSGRSPGRPAG
jgi:pimeloyl-ACP methyl ester carboxylesterase